MSSIVVAASDLDEAIVQRLSDHLTSEGFEVHRLSTDRDDENVDVEIQASVAFVPVLSEHSVGHGSLRRRTEWAREWDKPIVTLRLTRREVEWLEGDHAVSATTPGTQGIAVRNLARKLVSILDGAATSPTVDIRRSEQLIRYAVAAQLIHINSSAAEIAGDESCIDKAELTSFLAGEGTLSAETLRALDEAIVTIGSARGRDHIGDLAQFADRMRELTNDAAVPARIPPGWTYDALNSKSPDEVHVLAQATALVRTFLVADQVGIASEVIREHHRDAITNVVDRLILLAGGPQTHRQLEAQLLLGSLARFAFETVRQRLSVSISYSALGFRSWRSVTKLVMIARNIAARRHEKDSDLVASLIDWLQTLVRDAADLRRTSLYPGRSLDLELFIAIPWEWGLTDSGDIVTEALLQRARDDRATLRERGTAAMGAWQRAVENKQTEAVREALEQIANEFSNPSADSVIANGLRWVGSTLRAALGQRVAVLNVLPAVDEDWYQAVDRAASALGTGHPEWVRLSTRHLFKHALLQNAGVERRRAIDTLRAGGLVEPAARQLFRLLRARGLRQDAWLRVRVLFAIAFLRVPTDEAEEVLVHTFRQAADRVVKGTTNRAELTELQEILFTISDVFGVTGAEDETAVERARQVRNRIAPILIELVEHDHTNDAGRQPIARALAYLLMFMAQPAQPGQEDLSRRLLGRLIAHPDEMTSRISDWAHTFRWDGHGRLRPLLSGTARDQDIDPPGPVAS